MEQNNKLRYAQAELHKDLHRLMTSFMEEWNEKTDKLLAELLAKYRPYESEMLDDYGVLYEADFYFREGTSTCEEFLKAYDEFLRRIHHLND